MIKPFSITHQVRHFLVIAVLLLMTSALVSAQTTTFTYQGRLQDTGTPANGTYDLEFTLWDAASGGTSQPQPSPVIVTRSAVSVANGIFTVQLDFGANAFPGADRFLEIGVRPAGGGAFTTLSPRQQTTSTPYAVRSANATTADTATTATNATQLGSVAAGSYVQTSDTRLSDSRAPTAGSPSYVQNATAQQASSNFNISGNGVIGGNLIANGHVGIGTSTTLNARLNVNGSNLGGCNAATIGFGAPTVGVACNSALQLTTDAPNQSNLITGSNSSLGGVFVVSGSGAVGLGTPAPL